MGIQVESDHRLKKSLGFEFGNQRRWLALSSAAKFFHPPQPLGDVSIELFGVIPVICQGGVDLPERQIRMLEVKFLGTPAVSQLLSYQLYYLQSGALKHGYTTLI